MSHMTWDNYIGWTLAIISALVLIVACIIEGIKNK